MQVIKNPPAKHSVAQSLLSVCGYEALPADQELWLQHAHIHPWELPWVTALLLCSTAQPQLCNMALPCMLGLPRAAAGQLTGLPLLTVPHEGLPQSIWKSMGNNLE